MPLGFIFFCGIISVAVAGWARHPAEMCVLSDIRLWGAQFGGVSEQPGFAPHEELCPREG